MANILFRVDASLNIGTGHVMRCLTLAEMLRQNGAHCHFVSRAHEGHLNDLIAAKGFALSGLPAANDSGKNHKDWLGVDWQTDAHDTRRAIGPAIFDWLVVDHYALDAKWEAALAPHCQHILAIDDLADRPHECTLLLDQNLGRKPEDYKGLTPPECRLYLGPAYALLRPEFRAWRQKSLSRRQQNAGLKNMLVTLGGVDQHNITGAVLTALKACPLPRDVKIRVVMGPKAPWLSDVKAKAASLPWPCEVLAGVSNMAELMATSDLAIGAAGSTAWERCCLGLPTLTLVLADNQIEIATALEKAGAIILLPRDELKAGLKSGLFDILAIARLSELAMAAADITNGTGAEQVAKAIRKAGK